MCMLLSNFYFKEKRVGGCFVWLYAYRERTPHQKTTMVKKETEANHCSNPLHLPDARGKTDVAGLAELVWLGPVMAGPIIS